MLSAPTPNLFQYYPLPVTPQPVHANPHIQTHIQNNYTPMSGINEPMDWVALQGESSQASQGISPYVGQPTPYHQVLHNTNNHDQSRIGLAVKRTSNHKPINNEEEASASGNASEEINFSVSIVNEETRTSPSSTPEHSPIPINSLISYRYMPIAVMQRH